MADAWTSTSALGTDTTAYDRFMYWELVPQLMFDAAADVRPTNQTHQGAAVVFRLFDHLAAQTATLNEITDVEVIALSDSTVTLTLAEKGAAVGTTRLLRGTSYFDIDEAMLTAVAYNAGYSLDTLARDALLAGTNVAYSGGAPNRAGVDTGDQITANDVRRMRVRLVNANVMPLVGNLFKAYVAPDVAFDLRTETGDANWRDPQVYAGVGGPTEAIKNGSIGVFEGFDFSEQVRLSQAELPSATWADAGVGNIDVYPSIFMGRQALAKAYSATESGEYPQMVIARPVDRLERLHTVGWKWLGAYGILRQAALWRLESMSTIGTN